MGTRQWFAAVFLVMLGSAIFLSLFTYTGSLVYEVWWKEERFDRETYLASVDISEMTKSEAINAVEEELEVWKNDIDIQIRWFDYTYEVPSNVVHVRLEELINELLDENNFEKAVLIDVAERDIAQIVSEFPFYENLEQYVDLTNFTENMKNELTTLPNGTIQFSLHPYLEETIIPNEAVIASAVRSGLASPMLESIVEKLKVVTIHQDESFSFLTMLEEHNIEAVNGESLQVLSSAIYEVLLQSNFDLIERHQRHKLYDNIPLGYDAFIDLDSRDLVFFNPNDYEYELHFLMNEQGELMVELVGNMFPYEINVVVEQLAQIEPKTKVRYASDVSEGSQQVIEAGEAGYHAKTIRSIISIDGELEYEKVMAEDFYAPQHRLEIHRIQDQHRDEDEESSEDDLEEKPTLEDVLEEYFNGDEDESELSNGENHSNSDEDFIDDSSSNYRTEELEGSGNSDTNKNEDDGANNGADSTSDKPDPFKPVDDDGNPIKGY